MTIRPIRGRFENWRALLAVIAEDDDVENLAVITVSKDGVMKCAHFEMTREQMAFASVLLAKRCIDEE